MLQTTFLTILLFIAAIFADAPSWQDDIKPCLHVWDKMHEIYPVWAMRMKFYGVAVGERDDATEWGMSFLVNSKKDSEDHIPFNLAKCLTTIVENTVKPTVFNLLIYLSIFYSLVTVVQANCHFLPLIKKPMHLLQLPVPTICHKMQPQ